ncbi:MAG TPA: hypothetical protein VFI17_02160, partial [Solirubrobacterales bacterium]|nr:hypothetical protein [Solirubrobacterales bacterium]
MQARPKSMLSRIWCAAALAALAATCLAAPTASGATLRSNTYPTTLTASQLESAVHKLTLDSSSVECATHTGSGTLEGASE